MKIKFLRYINFIGIFIVGLVFGLSFFILFINLYHYRSTSDFYLKQINDYNGNDIYENKIAKIKSNISSFESNSYHGNQDVNTLENIKSRLNVCVNNLSNDMFSSILKKDKININDVYMMQQFYQINISNECLVKQLYEISIDDKLMIQGYGQENIRSFMKLNIETLIKSTDYLQKVIKNNSSYYFNSVSSKNDIYDEIKDSYYEILNNYDNSIDLIYDISEWFKEVSK